MSWATSWWSSPNGAVLRRAAGTARDTAQVPRWNMQDPLDAYHAWWDHTHQLWSEGYRHPREVFAFVRTVRTCLNETIMGTWPEDWT